MKIFEKSHKGAQTQKCRFFPLQQAFYLISGEIKDDSGDHTRSGFNHRDLPNS